MQGPSWHNFPEFLPHWGLLSIFVARALGIRFEHFPYVLPHSPIYWAAPVWRSWSAIISLFFGKVSNHFQALVNCASVNNALLIKMLVSHELSTKLQRTKPSRPQLWAGITFDDSKNRASQVLHSLLSYSTPRSPPCQSTEKRLMPLVAFRIFPIGHQRFYDKSSRPLNN